MRRTPLPLESPTMSVHADAYEADLGPGTPVYNQWAIEDDSSWLAAASAGMDDPNNNNKSKAAPTIFRTPGGRPSSNELWRFRRRGCQDCWAALFFFGLLAVVSLWGFSEIYHFYLTPEMARELNERAGMDLLTRGSQDSGIDKKGGSNNNNNNNSNSNNMDAQVWTIGAVATSLMAVKWLVWASVWCGISLTACFFSLALLRAMPRSLIYMQCYVQTITWAAVAILSGVQANLLMAVIAAFMAMIPMLWLYLVQDRIPFAVAMLSVASQLTQRHAGLLVVAVGVAVTMVLYFVLTACMLAPPALRALAGSPWPRDSAYVLLLVFTLFWVQQVLANVMHVTVSGVVATWYFAGEAFMPSSPIRASFRRAVTTSLGSICFGSLLVAVVRWVRFLAQAAASSDDSSGFLSCVCLCLVHMLEALVEYFNVYAFVHVAVYGCSYTEAARQTFALTQQCFFAAIFNDCLVSQAVDMLGLFTSVVLALVAGFVSWSVLFGIGVFFISLFITATVFQIVQSTVTAIFVCYAEVPAALAVSFPALFAELSKHDAGMTQSLYGTI